MCHLLGRGIVLAASANKQQMKGMKMTSAYPVVSAKAQVLARAPQAGTIYGRQKRQAETTG